MTPGVVRALALLLVAAGAAGCLVPAPQQPAPQQPAPGGPEGVEAQPEIGSGAGGADAGQAEAASPQTEASTQEPPGATPSDPAVVQVSSPPVAPDPTAQPVPGEPPVASAASAAQGQAPVEFEVGAAPSDPANPATTLAEMPAESAAPAPQESPQEGPAAAVQPPGEPSDPAAQAVKEVVRSYYEAYGARNWLAASELFWPTATVTSLLPRDDGGLGVVVLPADEYFARVGAESASAGPTGISRLADVELRATGRLAQAWCHYGGSYGEEVDLMKWHRFDAFTLLLHDDTWKIAALVVGPKSDRGPKTDRP